MKPNLSISSIQENFQLRGNSYKEGMLLLIEHLKNLVIKRRENYLLLSDYEDLVGEIDEYFEKYSASLSEINTFEAGQEFFNNLLRQFVKIQDRTSLNQPFNSLCEAERYSVWKKGREILATTVKSSEYELRNKTDKNTQLEITQQEIPLQDSVLLAKEYKKINDKIPPDWFKWLTPWQQDFIRTNQVKLIENSIPSSLRSVPGLANLSKHACFINGVESLSYFRHATPRPVDLMNNKDAYNEEYRITCLNIASQIRLSLEDQFKRADTKPIYESVILSQSLLSPGIAADIKSKISGPSDNDTEIYKIKEEIVELFQYALSHPNESVDEKHPQLKTLFFSANRVNQAIYYKDFLTEWDIKTQDNGLFQYKDHSPIRITFISVNHPINVFRYGGAYSQQTTKNENNTALLLGVVGRFLKPIFEEYSKESHYYHYQQLPFFTQLLEKLSQCEEEKKIVRTDEQDLLKIIDNLLGARHKFNENTQRLFCALQMLLSTPLDQGGLIDQDVRHNQLMISSAEALILHGIQGSLWVACKSGKDRTGIASAAYDAALLYYMQYKTLPAYNDQVSDRRNYTALLEKLFHSGHQQDAAGQNAPGAKGVVMPKMILPADVELDDYTSKLNTNTARLNKPSDPERRTMKNSVTPVLKKLTKRLFFKPVKERIAEIENLSAKRLESS